MDRIQNVHIRIEAGYRWNEGMDKMALHRFQDEVTQLLQGVGFARLAERPLPGASPTMVRGPERLYCHPMDLSGLLRPASIAVVKSAVQAARTFRLRHVDCYEAYTVYDPVGVEEAIVRSMPALRTAVFEGLRTRRTIHWHSLLVGAFPEEDAFVKRRFAPVPQSEADRRFREALLGVRADLIRDGYVLENKTFERPSFRSLNATELRKARLPAVATVAGGEDGLRRTLVAGELDALIEGWSRGRHLKGSVRAAFDDTGITMEVGGRAQERLTYAAALRCVVTGRLISSG